MKPISFPTNHIELLLDALLGACVVAFWLCHCPELLMFREQSQLFLFTADYLTSRLVVPGGLAQYIGEFLTQFFFNSLYGALCYALLLITARRLSARLLSEVLQSRKISYGISFLPVIMLWWLAYQPQVPLTPIMAYIITLALMILISRFGKILWVSSIIMMPVAYWFVGPMALFMSFLPFLHKSVHSSFKKAIGYTVVLTAIYMVNLWGSSFIAPYPLKQLAQGIDYCWDDSNIGTREEMREAYLWRNNKAQISPEMVKVKFSSAQGAMRSEASAFLLSEVYMHAGMVRMAQRAAFEAMEAIPNGNKSAWALHRLIETNMIMGQHEVAEKYLVLLDYTLFYRSWAQRMRKLLEHPNNIASHPFYGRLQKAFEETKDEFFL